MPLHITVLGPGCFNCERLASNAKQAAEQLGVEATIEKCRDYTEFARYGLLATPGLVVNDKLVSGGRVPSVAEITTMLTNSLSAA